jgi:hypothetical protein
MIHPPTGGKGEKTFDPQISQMAQIINNKFRFAFYLRNLCNLRIKK